MIKNILSVDVEEVFHGEYTGGKVRSPKYRTPYNIPKILKLLREYSVIATFFIVGEIAEKYPEVVKIIKEEGHEVAFHGWSHEPLWRLSPERFRDELRKFKIIYPKCMGFRAPSFSLNNKTKWALKVLAEEGFKYDSSIFPTWTPLYGVYGAPLYPYYPSISNITRGGTANSVSIIEFPLAVYSLCKLRIPIAGGFWLRLWNINLIIKGIRKLNLKGYPAVVYIHNWELDPETPRLKLNLYKSFLVYHNLHNVEKAFRKLLTKFRYTNFSDYIRDFL